MRWIERAATLVGGVSLAILVAIVAGSVVARYAMGQPIAWTEEAAGLLMVWIVMISAIACEARGEHLTIDIIEHYISPGARRGLAAVVGLASVGLLLVIGWYGWVLADASVMRRTNILKISWFWIYLPVALGGLLIAVVTLMKIFGASAGDAEQENGQ